MRPPPLPKQVDVLQRVLELVTSSQGEREPAPVVVFDVDGTLVDNRPRTLQILTEYAGEVRAEFPEVAACLDTLETQRVDYLLSATLRDCGLRHVDVLRDITHFWRERFFSDEYTAYDLPNEGALEYVNACFESGATVVYISSRDLPGMLVGTVASLRDHGFPIAVAGVELVFKPDATLPDEAFKRSALPALSRIGSVVGVFDNEPAACNVARRAFSEAEVALLETVKVPGAPEPDDGVHRLTDFRIL